MDAKVGDWVVTPRRGKAVEINALWYDALCFYESWLREEEQDHVRADGIAAHAARAKEAFNKRFWNAQTGCLYDVVDGEEGDDASVRPNQILAISLTHPVLDRQYWASVLEQVTERLLTPAGLRSLAPGEPDYKPRYDGDLRARDAAYHQGTVWGWLDRSLHRCLAAGQTGGNRDRAAVSHRFLPPFGRSLHRVDQRGVRRRSALYAARLSGAGLERRGSAAGLGTNRAARGEVERFFAGQPDRLNSLSRAGSSSARLTGRSAHFVPFGAWPRLWASAAARLLTVSRAPTGRSGPLHARHAKCIRRGFGFAIGGAIRSLTKESKKP